MEMSQATREVMWLIPTSFKVAMYVAMFLAMGLFAFGLLQKLKTITAGKGVKALLPEKLNWKNFIETIFFTGKVGRHFNVGIFHSMIYYGFVVLLIATELVAIHADTPLKIYKGPTYIIISFLADIAGLVILLGIGLAFKRRYIQKPDYLSATKPQREMFMYAMIIALVVLGYVLEGLRIAGTNMPIGEQTWSPVGWLVATLFNGVGFSESALAGTYKTIWMIHMLNTMAFIACIPFTKFYHIVAAPLSALITPFRRGAVLNAMDFEDETKETFGLGKASELTAKNRFDMMACVECGRCTQVCPANLSEKPLNPKTIITKGRDVLETAKKGEDIDLWENPLYDVTELDSCTTCGACMEECPMNIEHVNLIMELKRYKALTLGQVPPEAATAVNNIRVNGNPWGVSQDDRFQWADGLDVPVIEAGKKVDYLYYVGCAGSYDNNNQKVVQDTVNLLKEGECVFCCYG
jgi:heterodisulfide reductase subunit C/nitrate reductase gamma subunit